MLKLSFLMTGKIWRFSEIGVPPNHPSIDRFSIINHPFGGTPIDGNHFGATPINGNIHGNPNSLLQLLASNSSNLLQFSPKILILVGKTC